MNSRIKEIDKEITDKGEDIYRNHGMSKELRGFSFVIDRPNEFVNYRKKEYDEYYSMISSQVPTVISEFRENNFSRRLLFQFDKKYYEDKPENFMICPESFVVLFVSQNKFDIIINLRSTDINRLEEDISIIRRISLNIFITSSVEKIRCHSCNIHKYIK